MGVLIRKKTLYIQNDIDIDSMNRKYELILKISSQIIGQI